MTKHIVIFLSIILLAACSGGGSDGASTDSNADPKSNFNAADFTVSQLSPLSQNGEAQLKVQLNNLTSDDEIYITASSADIENAKLQITPNRSILNPNKGSSQILLSVKDLGLSSQPDISIEVTTSGNTKMEQIITMEWVN